MFASRNFLFAKSAAVAAIGNLFSWGRNSAGQLGLGNTTSYSSPVNVGTLKTWATPATSKGGSMCTKTDGTLWTWGYRSFGQQGLGNNVNYSSPKQIGSLTNWSKPTRGGPNLGGLKLVVVVGFQVVNCHLN